MPDKTSSAVAIVCDGWDIKFVGSGPISSIVENHNIRIGTKLVTQDRLLEALERAAKAESAIQRLAVEMERFRSKWRTISIKEFGYFADMASQHNLGHGPKGAA